MGLTVKQILRLRTPGKYHDGKGLYLEVKSATSRSWSFRYTRNGKASWHGLGSEADVTLEAARVKAFNARQQVRSGIDPIIEKKKQRQETALAAVKTETFEKCVDGYFETIRWAGRKKHAKISSKSCKPMCCPN